MFLLVLSGAPPILAIEVSRSTSLHEDDRQVSTHADVTASLWMAPFTNIAHIAPTRPVVVINERSVTAPLEELSDVRPDSNLPKGIIMAKTTIYQTQVGVLLQDGIVTKVLNAGTYRTYGFRNEMIVVYPVHRQSFTYSINVSTAEAAAIVVEATIGVTVTDARKLHLSGKSDYEIVSQIVSRQLVAAVEVKKLAELLESNVMLDDANLRAELTQYGLEAVIELRPKIRLPRNLQNAIDAQEVARQKAKAELEEARGRSAVIRHYANVAKVTKDNPDLLRLLLGQKAKSINVAFDAVDRSAK